MLWFIQPVDARFLLFACQLLYLALGAVQGQERQNPCSQAQQNFAETRSVFEKAKEYQCEILNPETLNLKT